MKKLSLLFLALGMMFAFNANASTIPEGAIVKTAGNPDVYIVKYNNSKNYKRLVLNPLVFSSYGHLKWENLLTISDSEMNSFITSDLVRVDGSSDVYQLVPEGDNGGKYQLASTSGYDLDSIYTINHVDFDNYLMRGNKDTYYTSQTEVSSGIAKMSSNMPIKIVQSEDDDLPMNKLALQTWYGLEIENLEYMIWMRAIELQDFSKINFSMELPSGKTAYAKNFVVARINDKWQLSADYEGVLGLYITDYFGEDERSYSWEDDSLSILPDNFQNEEFCFFLYIDLEQ